jgi:hypothetical protein
MFLLLAFQISVGNGVTFFTNPTGPFLDKFGHGEIGLGAYSSPLQNSKRGSFVAVSGREKLWNKSALEI